MTSGLSHQNDNSGTSTFPEGQVFAVSFDPVTDRLLYEQVDHLPSGLTKVGTFDRPVPYGRITGRYIQSLRPLFHWTQMYWQDQMYITIARLDGDRDQILRHVISVEEF